MIDFALQQPQIAHVCFGSFLPIPHVRAMSARLPLASKITDVARCLRGAKSGSLHCQKSDEATWQRLGRP
jgi:hypothetical protein